MKLLFITILSWIIEIGYWIYNFFSYIFSFVELKPLTRKTIFIVTPTFTGPFLYRKAKKYLENKGFNVIIYNFTKEIKDIDTSAEKLKKILDDMNLENVCLVGISAAGLTCYEYVNKLDGWGRVDTFVSIGTPFKGTLMSYFAFHTKIGRRLIPKSSYIAHIQSIKPRNLDKTYCLVATKDEIVPKESSMLSGAHFIEVPVLGHVRLHAFSDKTFEIISQIAMAPLKSNLFRTKKGGVIKI